MSQDFLELENTGYGFSARVCILWLIEDVSNISKLNTEAD